MDFQRTDEHETFAKVVRDFAEHEIAPHAAVDAARHTTQVFGGSGYLDETPVSRVNRDAKILEIGEGTSEIQCLVISGGLGLPIAESR